MVQVWSTDQLTTAVRELQQQQRNMIRGINYAITQLGTVTPTTDAQVVNDVISALQLIASTAGSNL